MFSGLGKSVLLHLQQIFLHIRVAGVAAQTAVGTDHPVAGDQDADRIVVTGVADCPDGFGAANGVGKLPIGTGLAIRDLQELCPDRLLERGALGRKRKIELPAYAGKVFRKLFFGLLQEGCFHHTAGQGLQIRHAVRAEMQPAQGIVFFFQTDGAQKAVDVPDVQIQSSLLVKSCYTKGMIAQNAQ